MKGVNYIYAENLRKWDTDTETTDGWKLARPMGLTGIIHRFKMSYLVFTGKCDVLKWHKQ